MLSHNVRSIFDILIDTNPKARPKNTPQVCWVRVKHYSTDISENCHGSGQKDKHTPWYIKYKLLNENRMICTKEFNKTAKQIVQFSFSKIQMITSFYQGYFDCILFYTL